MKAALSKLKMPAPRSASRGVPPMDTSMGDSPDEAEGAEGEASGMPEMAKHQAAEDGATGAAGELDHIPDEDLLAELKKRGLAPEGSPEEEAMEPADEAEAEGDAPAPRMPLPKRKPAY